MDIQSFLHNSGWWSRADNLTIRDAGKSRGKSREQMVKSDSELIKFIRANRNLVHPNTLINLNIKDNESIRMALNQIHYGSLKVSRQVNESKGVNDNINPVREEVNTHKGADSNNVGEWFKGEKLILYFIKSFSQLVEPGVLLDAMKGGDKALSLAIGQIHHKTIKFGHLNIVLRI